MTAHVQDNTQVVDLLYQCPSRATQAHMPVYGSSTENVGDLIGDAGDAQPQLVVGSEVGPGRVSPPVVIAAPPSAQGVGCLPPKQQAELSVLSGLLFCLQGLIADQISQMRLNQLEEGGVEGPGRADEEDMESR